MIQVSIFTNLIMKQWEYKVESYWSETSSSSKENALNRFGVYGWELVAVNGDEHYFKREINEEDQTSNKDEKEND